MAGAPLAYSFHKREAMVPGLHMAEETTWEIHFYI